jgi:hypothetical protein
MHHAPQQAFAEGWKAPGAGSGGESQRHVTLPRHSKALSGSGTGSAPLSPSSLNSSSHHSVSSHTGAGPVLAAASDHSGSVRLDRHHAVTAVSARLQHAKAGTAAHYERSSIAGSSGSGGSGSGSGSGSAFSSGAKPHTAVQIVAAPTAAAAAAAAAALAAADSKSGVSNGLKSNGFSASPTNGRYSGQGGSALQTPQTKFVEVRVMYCICLMSHDSVYSFA